MINDWISKFTKCLELGTTDSSLARSFDQIIIWMRSSNSQEHAYQVLLDKYGLEGLTLRYEEFLDRLLVSENAVSAIFPHGMNDEDAKKRYRQLIRVFHPDRGAHDQVWLNYRAERINKAFSEYSSRPVPPEANLNAASVPTPPQNNAKAKKRDSNSRLNTKIKYRPNALRQKLGDARQVQKRILQGLSVFSIALISIVYVSSRDIEVESSTDDTSSDVRNADIDSLSEADNIDPQNSLELNVDAARILDEAKWLDDEPDSNYSVIPPEASSDLNVSIDESGSVAGIADDVSELQKVRDLEPISHGVGVKQLSNTDSQSETNNNEVSSEQDSFRSSDQISTHNVSKCNISTKNAFSINDRQAYFSKVNLNVRRGPSRNCTARVSLMPNNDVVKLKRLLVNGESWVYISWQKGSVGNGLRRGWVSENFLIERSQLVSSNKTRLERRLTSKAVTKVKTKSAVRPGKDRVITPAVKKPKTDVANKQLSKVETPPPGWETVLKSLDKAFEDGDAVELASLYTAAGRENRVRGADRIQKLYASYFSKTTNRKITYNVDSHESSDELGFVLNGTMISVVSRGASSRRIRSAATFEMVIVKAGSRHKIASFVWKAI